MISIITTIRNEADSLEEFLGALLAQTLPADEIVVADGGSTDATPEILRRMAAAHRRLRPLFLGSCRRSEGRNAAIKAAAGDIIAVTDAGSRAAPDWLARITAPLRADPAVDYVAGYYRAVPRTPLQQAIAAATVVPVELVHPATFLPSSRSLAMRKAAWRAVGGYPEWMYVSEDTWFALALRKAGCRMAFAPDAVVEWQPASRLPRLFRQFYHYARGDAQAGLWFPQYAKGPGMVVAAILWVAGRRVPGLRWAIALGAALYLGKQSLRAARRTGSAAAAALTPAVSLTLDLAHLAGYVSGLLGGRKRPEEPRMNANERE